MTVERDDRDQQPVHSWTPGDRITHNGKPGIVFEVDDLGGIGYYADGAPVNEYTGQTCPTYLTAEQAATAPRPAITTREATS